MPDFSVVGEAANGAEAVEAVERCTPDVALVDIRMPVMDGVEATRRIVAGGEKTRVLIVTTFDRDEYVFQALRAGASGFVLKDTPPEQLVEAIHVVAAGEALLTAAITRRLIGEFVRQTVGPTCQPAISCRNSPSARKKSSDESPPAARTPSWPRTSTSAWPPRRPT